MSLSALIFIGIFSSASLFCLFHSPFFGIMLYEFVYFMNPQARWWYGSVPDLRYSFLVVLMIFIGYLLRYKEFKINRLSDIPQFKWLGGLTLIVLLSFFWSVGPEVYKMLTFRYLKYLVFVFFFYKIIDSQKSMDTCILVYLVGLFYISFLAWQMGRGGSGRIEGIGVPDGEEVNGTAAAVVTAVPLMVYSVLFCSRKWVNILALIGLTFVLNGLILFNSRGAFLAIIASICWFSLAIFREKGIGSTKWKLFAGLTIGALLFLYLADALFWERMSTLQAVSTETEGGTRMLFWLKTFDMLADHPFGMGAMGYQLLSADYLPAEWLSRGARAEHSLWFEVLASYGFQGFVVFLGYIFSTFFLARKVKKYLREKGDQLHLLQLVALEAAFVAFLVAATFINRFHAEMLYWLPAFIAAFANIYMIKPQREEAAERFKSNH